MRRAQHDFKSLLNDETILQYPLTVVEAQVESQHIKQMLARMGLPFNIGLEVGNYETLKHYVSRGLGIALVSGLCLTKSDHARFEIVKIPVDFGAETSFGVILRKDKSMSPPLKTLLQLLNING